MILRYHKLCDILTEPTALLGPDQCAASCRGEKLYTRATNGAPPSPSPFQIPSSRSLKPYLSLPSAIRALIAQSFSGSIRFISLILPQMVAIVDTATPRERLARSLNSATVAPDIPSKLDHLGQVKDDLLQDDPVLLAEFLPQLLQRLSDSSGPVRKFIIKYDSLYRL